MVALYLHPAQVIRSRNCTLSPQVYLCAFSTLANRITEVRFITRLKYMKIFSFLLFRLLFSPWVGRVRIKFLRRKVARVCLLILQLFLYRFCTLRNTSKSVFALVSLLLLADHFQTCISWLNINRVIFISVCSTKPALRLLCFLAIFCGIVFLLHVSAAVPHKVKKYKQFGGSKAINLVL